MIRHAELADLPELRRVYRAAKEYMDASGNPGQWVNGYPREELLREDIEQGRLYALCGEDGALCGAFVLMDTPEPRYDRIDGPGWRAATPYGTLHRIAGDGSRHGLFQEAMAFARARFDHLRIDTHADNRTMQHLILKSGFVYTGIVDYGPDGLRLAYDWIKEA